MTSPREVVASTAYWAFWKATSSIARVFVWVPLSALKKAMLSEFVSLCKDLGEDVLGVARTWDERVQSVYRDELFGE